MELSTHLYDGFALLAQAAPEPAIDGMFFAKIVTRVFHLLCAIIIGGGLFYMRTILAPSGADACFADRRSVWARWVGVATFLLLASGMFSYIVNLREAREAGAPMPSTYHVLFLIKFLLAFFVFFVAAILAGKTATADRFRANSGKWLKLAWTAIIAIVVVGAMMRSFHQSRPAAAVTNPPQTVEAQNG